MYSKQMSEYFSNLVDNPLWKTTLEFCIFDFVNKIKPVITVPVHYSGAEDLKYHDREILDDCQLQKWLNSQELKYDLPTKFQIAVPGEILSL